MGRALLVSPTAIDGLPSWSPEPWRVCTTPEQWRDEMLRLWREPEAARELGAVARAWVEASCSWEQAGDLAAASVERVSGRRR